MQRTSGNTQLAGRTGIICPLVSSGLLIAVCKKHIRWNHKTVKVIFVLFLYFVCLCEQMFHVFQCLSNQLAKSIDLHSKSLEMLARTDDQLRIVTIVGQWTEFLARKRNAQRLTDASKRHFWLRSFKLTWTIEQAENTPTLPILTDLPVRSLPSNDLLFAVPVDGRRLHGTVQHTIYGRRATNSKTAVPETIRPWSLGWK